MQRERTMDPPTAHGARPQPRPWVLLVDDGELDDVREIAASLGASTARHAQHAATAGWRQPQRLLVVSDRRAATLGRPVAQEQDAFATLVVLNACPPDLRDRIHRMGFEMMLERPAPHAALRTLVRDALYRGRACVRAARLPVGLPVTLHTGWRRRDVQLVELSGRGCSLRVGSPLLGARRVALELPAWMAGGANLRVEGSVVGERSVSGRTILASVVFHLDGEASGTARKRLEAVVAGLRREPSPSSEILRIE